MFLPHLPRLLFFDCFWYTVCMDSLMKADIFFMITTIAVCAVSVVAIWVLVHLVKILRNVEDISETVKKETQKFSQDIDGVREHIKQSGALPRFVMSWIGRFGGTNTKRERARKSDKK